MKAIPEPPIIFIKFQNLPKLTKNTILIPGNKAISFNNCKHSLFIKSVKFLKNNQGIFINLYAVIMFPPYLPSDRKCNPCFCCQLLQQAKILVVSQITLLSCYLLLLHCFWGYLHLLNCFLVISLDYIVFLLYPFITLCSSYLP